jgi:hypothetical protein
LVRQQEPEVEVEAAITDAQIVLSKGERAIVKLRLNETKVKVIYTPPPPIKAVNPGASRKERVQI